jgi:DnaJ family protein C protein 7
MSLESKCTELKNTGNGFFTKKEYDTALFYYTQALDQGGASLSRDLRVALHSNRAECWLQLNRPFAAMRDASAALEVQPGHEKSQSRLERAKAATAGQTAPSSDSLKKEGNDAFVAKNYSRAAERYTEALMMPDTGRDLRVVLLSNRSECALQLNRPEAALVDANAALAIDPNHEKSKSRVQRAQQSIATGTSSAAAASAPKAEKKFDAPRRPSEPKYKSDNPRFMKAKDEGNAFFKAGKFQEAVDAYTRALEVSTTPEDKATALVNRAAANYQLKNSDPQRTTQVIIDCNEVIELDSSPNKTWPSTIKAYLRRGLAYEEKEKYEQAIEDMRRVLMYSPDTKQAMDALGRLQRSVEMSKRMKKG